MQDNRLENVVRRIYPIVKAMKISVDDVVVLCNRHIIVCSYNCRLAVVELLEDTCESFICKYCDIEYFINGKSVTDELTGAKKKVIIPFAYNYDMPQYYKMIDLYNKYTSYSDSVYYCDDVQTEYPQMFELKSSDGYISVNFGDHRVIVFAGIVSAAKTDKVSMEIYNGENDTKFVVRYDIYKKKLNITISVYTVNLMLK